MTAPPALQLFGAPALESSSGRVVFTTERPFQLLCHLASRRQWVRRDELADILWPEHDPTQARRNLRKVLLLAARVPGVGSALERQGDRVRWQPDTDLARFELACDERRFADAVELAAEPLLEGFESAFAGVGAAWLVSEQRRVAGLWQAVCLQRMAELDDQPAVAIRLARRMLARDPFDEAAMQALARAHLALGERDVAAGEIAAYARRLDEEFGVEPPAALRALASAAQGSPHPMSIASSAPRRDARFIGRRNELRELTELLQRPDCRLLTLTGPGGIGKTTTAAMLAMRLAPGIVDSVVTVPLADLTEADQVPSRLAARLGTTLDGGTEPWTQIAAAIGDRSLALVLDNAEHLAVAECLGELLDATPRLRLIVTSRARMGIAGETAFALEGLPLPDDDETDVDVLRRCDAVALFETRSLTASRSFDLAAQSADVVHLVHLVEGLPLAIELAANWTRMLPVAEIANEIERSIDMLESYVGAERSLRASFAQSWRLLSARERDCLPRLSLLPGDFGRDMAQQVAGSSLPVIAALVDKSLLRSDGSGRFSMHGLLRRCAAEHADPDDALLARLAAFVASWLGKYADLQVGINVELLRAIEREIAHVRAAWDWAILHGDADVIGSIVRPLSTYFEERGMWTEGLGALGHGIDALAASGPSAARARAQTYRGLALLQYRDGALEAAEASATQVIAFAAPANDGHLLMSALNTIGLSLWQRGLFEDARMRFEHALQRAQQEGSARALLTFQSNIALIHKALGRYPDALAMLERVLQGEQGATSRATTLNNLANVERALGRSERGIERLNEALVLCTQHGLESTRPTVTTNLGLCHMELGQPAVARKWLEQSLDESRRCGQPLITMAALLALSHLDLEAAKPKAALEKAWQAMGIAERIGSMEALAECVAGFGEICAHDGSVAEGLALMRWAIAQPTFDQLNRDITSRRVAALVTCHGEPERFDLPSDAPLANVLTAIAARR